MPDLEKLTYESKLGNVVIEYEVNYDKNIAWFGTCTYDNDNIKMFILTLKLSIDDLKNKHIEKLQQLVTGDDWNNYLVKDNRWQLLNINYSDNTHIIECNIDDAIAVIGDGLGIKN